MKAPSRNPEVLRVYTPNAICTTSKKFRLPSLSATDPSDGSRLAVRTGWVWWLSAEGQARTIYITGISRVSYTSGVAYYRALPYAKNVALPIIVCREEVGETPRSVHVILELAR